MILSLLDNTKWKVKTIYSFGKELKLDQVITMAMEGYKASKSSQMIAVNYMYMNTPDPSLIRLMMIIMLNEAYGPIVQQKV